MGVIVFEEMSNQNENLENKAVRRPRLRPPRRLGLLALLVVAAFLRFFNLGNKPPHFDEGINGHFVMTIWRDGFYSYDPTNFHGPLYFYLCHLAEILLGRSVETFRVMNSVLAMLVVYAVYQFRRFKGIGAVLAAWIIALSPAFTFYGRYAIHETLFTLGQILFVYGRFLWMGRPSRAGLGWMATGIIILVSTKETFFIFIGIWIIAELMIRFVEKLEHSKRPWSTLESLSPLEKRELFFDIGAVAGISILILAALFSGFFERAQGLVDFFRAFAFWSKTGMTTVSGHEKPFAYWLELFARYEWPLLIGLVVACYATVCLREENRKQRILLLAGFGAWLAYSLVPYKTPWLTLSFWPLAFLMIPAFESQKLKYAFRFVIAVALLAAGRQAWQLNFVKFADPKEPYVYVQTTMDYLDVMGVLRKKIDRAPEAKNDIIVVMIQDPWPLPFDLSLYPKMRYARPDDLVKDPSILRNASLMLVDGSMLQGLRNVFPKRYARMKFQLRDAYAAGWALFDADEFASVLPMDVEIEDAVGDKP